MEQKPSEGRTITFKPSESTRKKIFHQEKNKDKTTFPAVITDVNEKTVDLTVFGIGETAYVSNIPHVSDTNELRSSWAWPERV